MFAQLFLSLMFLETKKISRTAVSFFDVPGNKKNRQRQKEPFPILKQKYKDKTTNRGKAGKSTMKLVTNTVTFIIKGLPLFVVYGSRQGRNSLFEWIKGENGNCADACGPAGYGYELAQYIHHSTHEWICTLHIKNTRVISLEFTRWRSREKKKRLVWHQNREQQITLS